MTTIDGLAPSLSSEIQAALVSLKPGESWCLDRPITIEEFCELFAESEVDLELVNGVVYMTPPPTDDHEDAQGWFFKVLSVYVEEAKLGKVRGSRSGVRVGATSLPEPNVLFFENEHLDRMTASGVHGAPDFAAEIIGSNQARRDAVRKQAQYQEADVTEFWAIDLPRRELRQFLLEDGRYRRLDVDPEGEVCAVTIEGFRLQTRWLFQGPAFPTSLEVVTGLLAQRRQA